MHILHIDKTDPRAGELLALLKREKFSIRVESNSIEIIFNASNLSVTYMERVVVLTKKEFALLSLLNKFIGSPVARDTIIRDVWNMSIDPFSNTLEVHVRSLRKKLGAPNIIHTIPRVGYKLSLLP